MTGPKCWAFTVNQNCILKIIAADNWKSDNDCNSMVDT